MNHIVLFREAPKERLQAAAGFGSGDGKEYGAYVILRVRAFAGTVGQLASQGLAVITPNLVVGLKLLRSAPLPAALRWQ